MVRETNIINISSTDSQINSLLQTVQYNMAESANLRKFYYNHGEDQFIILKENLYVPSFPIHHAIENKTPPPNYIENITALCTNIMQLKPELLAGCTWFFDSTAIHRPSFYRIYQWQDYYYLHLIRIDLSCKTLECNIIEQGSNDKTHAYESNRLYIENDFYPLQHYLHTRKELELKQTIPTTWRGESGQGYMVHGIWMDSDINKFFSKLILPEGKRTHPYYPVTCKHHCISLNAMGIPNPALLHKITDYLQTHLDDILSDLNAVSFSETMSLFKELKKNVPVELGTTWEQLHVKPYLNDQEQKEYKVEF